MRRSVPRRVLVGVAAALIWIPVRNAGAAFEIRPGALGGGPLLPAGLPAPLSASSDLLEDRSNPHHRLEFGVLHLRPQGLDAIALDAFAVGWRQGACSWGFRLSRLRVPLYSEWTAGIEAVPRPGFRLVCWWLGSRSDSELRNEWGIEPRDLGTLSLAYERSWSRRAGVRVWLRDALRTPGAAREGIRSVPGAEAIFRLSDDWRVRAGRSWEARGGSPGGGAAARDRLEVIWSPDPAVRLGQGWGSRPLSSITWVQFGLGGAHLQFWTARSGEGVAPTTGAAVTIGLAGPGFPGGDASESASSPRTAAAGSEPWVIEDADLAPPDSFWTVGDSLETLLESGLDLNQNWGGEADDRPDAAGPLDAAGRWPPGRADHRAGLPIPLDRLTPADLDRLPGLAETGRAELWRYLEDRRDGDLPDLGDAPPRLRWDLLELVPYLTTGPPSPPGHWATGAAGPRTSRTSWLLSGRGKGAGCRGRSYWDGQVARGPTQVRLRLRSNGWRGPVDRGLIELRTGRLRLTGGRGGRLVRWGLGLVASAEPIRLRTARSILAGEYGPELLRPSLGGPHDVLGAELSVSKTISVLASSEDGRAVLGVRQAWRWWEAGMLSRPAGGQRGPPILDLWVCRRGDRQEVTAEVAGSPGRAPHAALSWSRGLTPGGGIERIWWSARVVRPLNLDPDRPGAAGTPQSPGLLYGGREQLDFLQRVRLGGATGRQQVSGEWEWSRRRRDDGRARERRSAQLRLAGRLPRSLRWEVRSAHVNQRVRSASGFEVPASSRYRRYRLRAVLSRGGSPSSLVDPGRLGFEAGWEGIGRTSATGSRSGSGAGWIGLWRGGRLLLVRWNLGALQTTVRQRASVRLAPSWTGGTQMTLPGDGLWLSGQAGLPGKRVDLRFRFAQPVRVSVSGSSRAEFVWQLTSRITL